MSTRAPGDRAAIEAELLAWMREAPDENLDEARFDRLARALFAFQYEACPPYRRFCEMRGARPGRIAHWSEVPAVPAGAFKELALRCFDEADTVKTFRTSGTSRERRGALHLDTLALYEASLLPTFRRHVFPDLEPGERFDVQILAPSSREVPDSSLSHMFDCVLDALGSEDSGHLVVDGALRLPAAVQALARAVETQRPLALCGTSFAFVHLLDALAARGLTVALPADSRIMETGGYKGRARELSGEALREALSERLDVAPGRVVNQYGMTELGSQLYDSVLRDPRGPRRKLGPPWVRVRILNPETGREVGEGEPGVITIHDLANTGSVAALETADLGRWVGEDGFEVLGRREGAEARGCAIAADVMLRAPA